MIQKNMNKEFWEVVHIKSEIWRKKRIEKPCEFCKTNPRKIKGIFDIIDRFVYGKRCSFCFDLINTRQLNTDKEIIEKVGIIE